MTLTNLSHLLRPSTVAVLGATPTPGKAGHRCIEALEQVGFGGDILPINPAHERIGRWPCFRSVDALPDTVDVVIAAIPKAALMADGVLASVGRKTRNLVVFASGFADRGAAEDQRALADLARGGLGVLGPNTMGFVYLPSHVAATFAPSIRLPTADVRFRPIAIASHSGGIAIRVFNRLLDIDLVPAFCASTGNEAGYTLADLVRQVQLLDSCSTLLLYVENLNAGNRLLDAIAEATAGGHRVVVALGGRTMAGSAAARSHTGAMTSDLRAASALFREAGAHLARGIDDLVDAATVTVSRWSATGRALAIVSNSGGRSVLASDAAESADFTLPRLALSVATGLPVGEHSNPIDVTAAGVPVDVTQVVKDVAADPRISAVLVEIGQTQWPTIATAARGSTKPVIFEMADATTDDVRAAIARDVPAFASVDRAIASVRFARARAPIRGASAAGQSHGTVDASDLLHSQLLDRIRDLGLSVVPYRRVTNEREAREALNELGLPIVVKADVRGPLHKTEEAAVRAGLHDQEAYLVACTELLERWDALVVEPQLYSRLDLLVGGKRVADVGRVAVIGIGGLLAELSVIPPAIVGLPASSGQFRRQLALLAEDEPRIYRLLTGYRGVRIAEDALVGALQVVDALLDDFLEVDMNPVFVDQQGQLTAIDCRVA